MDCFVAIAPLRKRFAFVAGNDAESYRFQPDSIGSDVSLAHSPIEPS
jgi:hypothetical protein